MQVKALLARQVTQGICTGIHCLLSGAEVSLGHSCDPEEMWLLVTLSLAILQIRMIYENVRVGNTAKQKSWLQENLLLR